MAVNNQLRGRPAQLRSASLVRALGWESIIKPAQPPAGAGFTRVIPPDFWERILSFGFTFVTSAAAGIRSLALIFTDGDGFTFNLVPLSNEIGPSQNLTAYADLASVTQVQVPESHQAEAAVTAPAAGAAIVSLALPSGGWTLNWLLGLSGTPGAGDANNFQLRQGAAVLTGSVNPGAVGGPWQQDPVEVQVPVGGATVSVNANGVGTAGAVYAAQLVASPANVVQLQAQIPDFVLKSGWTFAVQIGGVQAGDQLSNLVFLMERYPSSNVDLASPEVLGLPGSPDVPHD
jgi:hypothetical protein